MFTFAKVFWSLPIKYRLALLHTVPFFWLVWLHQWKLTLHKNWYSDLLTEIINFWQTLLERCRQSCFLIACSLWIGSTLICIDSIDILFCFWDFLSRNAMLMWLSCYLLSHAETSFEHSGLRSLSSCITLMLKQVVFVERLALVITSCCKRIKPVAYSKCPVYFTLKSHWSHRPQ